MIARLECDVPMSLVDTRRYANMAPGRKCAMRMFAPATCIAATRPKRIDCASRPSIDVSETSVSAGGAARPAAADSERGAAETADERASDERASGRISVAPADGGAAA